MRHFRFAALILLVASVAHADSSSLPSAPTPLTASVFRPLDYGLAAGVVAVNGLDFSSTRACISRPAIVCREGVLPTSLVHSTAGFAAYKIGITGLELLGQYELTKHGHRRLAELASALNVGFAAYTDIRNYHLASGSIGPDVRVIAGVGISR